MKLRLWPVIITIAASTVLLFGSWLIYHNIALKNPLNKVVAQAPGVQEAQTDIRNNQVTVDLTLNNQADLRLIYAQIKQDGAAVIGQHTLTLIPQSNSSPELEQWWSSALFGIAQAMDTRHYSDIPRILQSQAKQLKDLQVTESMDDTNVYIRLTSGIHSKYIILPRNPDSLGVWPNE